MKISSIKIPRALTGFTLIEMIVAVGIFMFVMVIAIGSLVAIVGADRKAQAIEAVVDNLRFALDDLSRTVRTATAYNCSTPQGGSCPGGDTVIWVTDQDGNFDSFKYDASCYGGGGCIELCTVDQNSACLYQPITSSEIILNKMRFYVLAPGHGSGPGAGQPKLTVTLSAQIAKGVSVPVNLNLETTVAQRIYNQ